MIRGFIDKALVGFGYIKSQAVALTVSAAMGFREYPSAKSKDELAAYTSWVYACVKARARDVSRIDLKLYKVTDRKTGEYEEVVEHEVLSLLRSVNPFMTSMQLFESTQSYKDLVGEAFWYLQRAGTGNSGMITQIWPLRPDYISIRTSKDGFISGYTYSVSGQTPINFEVNEIIHHKEFNPLNPYRGLSVVRAAAVTIDSENYAEEYNKKFFRNSAVPEVVLSTEKSLTPAQVKRMHAEWETKYAGTNNAHKTAILEGGLDIKSFSISQKDMEFLAGLGFSRDKILALFEVPKSRLGMTEGVTVSNAEATINIYLKYLVKPQMESIRDVCNEFLLPLYKGSEDMFFDITDPVPEDVNAEVTRLQAEFNMGALTPNEVRAEMGRDEVSGLDAFYLPLVQTPIEGEDSRSSAEAAAPAVQPIVDNAGKIIRGAKATRRKGLVKMLPMRLRDLVTQRIATKVRAEVMETVEKSLRATMPKFKELTKEVGECSWDYDKKQAFWKQLVNKADHFTPRYEKAVIKLFDDQEAGVLHRLESGNSKSIEKLAKSDIERILISVVTENKVAADLLLPIVKEILEESGNDTLDFLDSEKVFDASTEAVKQFVRTEALKGIRVMNKVTKSKLRKTLGQAIDDGLGPVEIAREIRGVFTEAKEVRSIRVARTESLKAANRGALEAYKQSGVVVGKQWLTSEDELVCQWCGPLDGKIQATNQEFFHEGESYVGNEGDLIKFNLESIPTPPLHPNCRCTIVPVTINQNNAHLMVKEPEHTHTHEVDEEALEKRITEKVTSGLTENIKEMIKE